MAPPTSGRTRSAATDRGRILATVASGMIPGLGQLLVGRRRAALLAASPLIVVVLLLLFGIVRLGVIGLGAQLTTPGRLALVGTLLLAAIPWRIAVILDLLRGAPRSAALAVALAVALIAAIAPEAGAAALAYRAQAAADSVFGGFDTPSPDASSSGEATPTPSPPPLGDRFTMLLIGADAMGDRTSFNTDSMIVASWDRVGGWVSTISIPRDIVNVPLGDGSLFPPKINGLWSYAQRHKAQFPKGPAVALSSALGALLGVKIDATAVIVIPTFATLVDKIGGVDVTIPREIFDPHYQQLGFNGVRLPRGSWHLDGECALAYARIRKAVGQDDFTRGARQQALLIAIRDQLATGGDLLGKGLALLDALGNGVRTDLNPGLIPVFADAAAGFDTSHVVRGALAAGDGILRYRHKGEYSPFGSVVFFDPTRMALLGERLFPSAGTRPYAWPVAKGDPALGGRPAPATPTPSVATSPVPTPSPTLAPSTAPASGSPTLTPSPKPTPMPHPYPTLGSCNAHVPRPGTTFFPSFDPTAAPTSSLPASLPPSATPTLPTP